MSQVKETRIKHVEHCANCHEQAARCGTLEALYMTACNDIRWWCSIALKNRPWWMSSDHHMFWALKQLLDKVQIGERIWAEFLESRRPKDEAVELKQTVLVKNQTTLEDGVYETSGPAISS